MHIEKIVEDIIAQKVAASLSPDMLREKIRESIEEALSAAFEANLEPEVPAIEPELVPDRRPRSRKTRDLTFDEKKGNVFKRIADFLTTTYKKSSEDPITARQAFYDYQTYADANGFEPDSFATFQEHLNRANIKCEWDGGASPRKFFLTRKT